jgi:hypothetical protein
MGLLREGGEAVSELQRCEGTNCGCTDGISHSAECRAEHDALCFQAEIGDLRAELAQRTAERDEARRDWCYAIEFGHDERAEERARLLGWDCFDAKEER